MIQAKALADTIPIGWQKEILSAGFAVTRQDHRRRSVLARLRGVTGSHNLGHKASFNNDENLLIVRGQRALAEAYATHVLDIYDHFSWRWMVQSQGKAKAETMLSVVPDEWQSR